MPAGEPVAADLDADSPDARTDCCTSWTSRSPSRAPSCCRCTGWPRPACRATPSDGTDDPAAKKRRRRSAGAAPTGGSAAAGSCCCRVTRRPGCGCRWTRSPGTAPEPPASRIRSPRSRRCRRRRRPAAARRRGRAGRGADHRAGRAGPRRLLHVFLPPLEELDPWVELIGAGRATPPRRSGRRWCWRATARRPTRGCKTLSVTPDPGVIEVNIQPTVELGRAGRELTTHAVRAGPAEPARHRDVRRRRQPHAAPAAATTSPSAAATPAESPLLRRPDLLVSLLTYWQHHPALSYLFSGRFIGPTSQAPRVDEGRPETLYELEIAFAEIARQIAGQDGSGPRRGWSTGRCGTCSPTSPATPTAPSSASTSCTAPTRRAAGSGCSSCAASRCRRTRRWRWCRRCWSARWWPGSGTSRCRRRWSGWGTDLHERFLLPHYVDRRHRRGGRRPAGARHRLRPAGWTRSSSSASRGSGSVDGRRRWSSSCAGRSSRGTCWARRRPPAAPRATSTPRSSGCRSA